MTTKLSFDHPVTLVGGGEIGPADLTDSLARAPALVAADGGAQAALAAGLRPDAVIGDMDSLERSPALRDAVDRDRLHEVSDQDSTDFEKCLARVAAPLLIGVGFMGRRADHTLASFTALMRDPRPILLISPWDVVFRAPRQVRLDLPMGARLSIYPFSPVTGTSEGLAWPIDGLSLAPMGRIGTSNRVTGPVGLTFDGDGALILIERGALDAALAALLPPGASRT